MSTDMKTLALLSQINLNGFQLNGHLKRLLLNSSAMRMEVNGVMRKEMIIIDFSLLKERRPPILNSNASDVVTHGVRSLVHSNSILLLRLLRMAI